MLPREIFGKSSFELAMLMLKWLPLWVVDKILLVLAWMILGNVEKYGLKRPSTGPLELKNTQGKSPVLDIGALERIKTRDIRVVPGIKKFTRGTVELLNGDKLHEIDSVILATGYCSNVPFWLQVRQIKIRAHSRYIYTRLPLFFLEQRDDVVFIWCRKLNSFPTTAFQNLHSQMDGKEKMDSIPSDSRGEGYLVHPQTPRK